MFYNLERVLMMKKSLLTIALALSMAACGQSPQSAPVVQAAPVQTAPAPQVVVVQQPQSSSGDLLTGAAVGMMVGHALSAPSYSAPTTVVNKTVIVKNYSAPAAVASPAPLRSVSAPSKVVSSTPRLSLSKPSSTSSSFGGFRRR